MDISRRDFSRLLALSGSMLLPQSVEAWPAPLAQTPSQPDERFWLSVREQFLMPPDLAVMNAANLCPSPAPVLEAMYRSTKDMDGDPSFENRAKMTTGKEDARRALAAFLRVTPEEIVITRNTSEANNIVSSGLDLKAGDEVVIFADNHPSNSAAWAQKAKRFGYTVTTIAQPNPHPGADYYVEAATRAISSRTRVLAFTHQTSTVGDVLPAHELCHLARERGVLTLVDGASAMGFIDVDLGGCSPISIPPAHISGRADRKKSVCSTSTHARTKRFIPASSARMPARSVFRGGWKRWGSVMSRPSSALPKPSGSRPRLVSGR